MDKNTPVLYIEACLKYEIDHCNINPISLAVCDYLTPVIIFRSDLKGNSMNDHFGCHKTGGSLREVRNEVVR
jgi:hypothetical protein